jgi:hypothetical protein
VLNVLAIEEEAELLKRVGILNVFDPLHPDGWHEMGLIRREERQASDTT